MSPVSISTRHLLGPLIPKLINSPLAGIATNKSIAAKPSKIVAGQEPEKTNELLQIIGQAVQNKVDSKKAIEEWRTRQATATANNAKSTAKATATAATAKKVAVTNKAGSKIINNVKKTAAPPEKMAEKFTEDLEKKPRVDSGIVEDTGTTTGQEEEIMNLEEKEIVAAAPPSIPLEPPPISDAEETKNGIESIKNSIEPAIIPQQPINEEQELINAIDEEASRRKKETKKPPSRKSSSDDLLKEQAKLTKEEPPVLDQPPAKTESNKVSKSVAKKEPIKAQKVETIPSLTTIASVGSEPEKKPARPRTSLRPPSVRPASARPGAPRRRDRNVEVVIQPEENVQLGDINVKVEQFKSAALNDDDDDSLIVIEDINIQDALLEQSKAKDLAEAGTAVDDANQGQLVKQILDSQKEFEAGDQVEKNDSLNWKTNNVKEMRDHIQKLTKSIQPLGKFMDFLLEDIDSMQREYDMWRDRGKEVALKIAREKNSIENTVQSLKHQLEELSIEVEEKQGAIFQIRETILQNEEKILKLFKNL